jgi:selenide, water dikinase
VLRHLPKIANERVLVGVETSDDAGVYLLDGDQVLIQTVDFFTPIVDDPYDYGQIAAANSLSDVYAMGGVPITALNIVGYPMKDAPAEWLHEILHGGADKAVEAGVAILGGHTVEDQEIKYGLSVTGLGSRDQITANRGARVGDRLVLTKALGTGLVTSAIKRGVAEEAATRVVVDSMKMLNRAASTAMVSVGVHACTDVTGFGLLGHLYEMLTASEVGARLDATAIPVLPTAEECARQGITTGGARNNETYLSDCVRFDRSVRDELRQVLFDPQTSGGLLMAVPPDRLEALLDALESERVPIRAVIGEVVAGASGRIEVTE